MKDGHLGSGSILLRSRVIRVSMARSNALGGILPGGGQKLLAGADLQRVI